MDPQPLAVEIWDTQVPGNFKPHSMDMFDNKSDSQEHIININIQMSIIRAIDSLKFKMIKEMLKEVTLCWYMSLMRFSITSYQDVTKMIHWFSTNKHEKVSTISLFNVLQSYSKSLREYLAYFNKETLKVTHQMRRK